MGQFDTIYISIIILTVENSMTDKYCASFYESWWRHQMENFPRHWPFVRGIHRSPVNSPHKGQWRGALMFSLICVWRNGWVNNRGAGDLRRHVVIMTSLQSMGPRFRPFLRDNTQTYAHSVISIRHYRVLFIRKSAKILLILTTKPRELSKCFNFVVTDDTGSFTTAKPGTCSVMNIIGVHHLTF